MKRPIHSRLQNRILLHLSRERVDSLAGLARSLDAHRSSVSRAAHALLARGLITQADRVWTLSEAGRQEIVNLGIELAQRADEAVESAARLARDGLSAKAASLLSPSGTESGVSVLDEYRSILSAATRGATTLLLHSAGAVSVTPWRDGCVRSLLQQAAGVDLLQSVRGFIDTLGPKSDLLTPTWADSISSLVQTVTKVDLADSLSASLQSVISLAAGARLTDSLGMLSNPTASEALPEIGSTYSAIECMKPLVSSLSDIRSFSAQYEPWTTVRNVLDHQEIALLIGDVKPIVAAAARFDAISAFGQDLAAIDLSSWQSSAVSVMSLLGHVHEPSLAPVLERVCHLALKPSLSEVALRDLAGGAALNNVFDVNLLGPSLARETAASLTHSHNIIHDLLHEPSLCLDTSFADEMRVALPDIDLCTAHLRRSSALSVGLSIGSPLAESMCNAAAIARTYEGLVAHTVHQLVALPSAPPSLDACVLATHASATLLRSLDSAGVRGEGRVRLSDQHPSAYWSTTESEIARLGGCFAKLGPQFARMWRGGWAVLLSDSPDRIRQAAHSSRELLNQTLSHLAPDTAFSREEIAAKGFNGKPTRKMRVKRILSGRSNSEIGWVDAAARSLDETYAQLSSVAHDHATQFSLGSEDLRSMMLVMGGLMDLVVRRGLR